jgi:hypothetical protein
MVLEEVPADEDTAQVEEGLVDVSASFVANAESAQLMEPGERAFDHPSVMAETTSMLGVPARQERTDSLSAKDSPVRLGVVASVRVEALGPVPRSSGTPRHGGNGVDQGKKLGDVVSIGSGQRCRQGHTVPVGHDMVLAARTCTIRRVRARFSPAPTARMLDESMAARDQSI